MTRIRSGLLALLVNLSLCCLAFGQRPNIVLILADDFGVGDIQAHYPDNKIPTPYLDRLVREGMSFTDAHSPSAVCSPTRYGLLTGRYAWRTRLQEWVIAAYEPPLITADRLTIANLLQNQGYRTACIGKWHLGWNWPGPQSSQMTAQRNGQWTLQWDFTQPIADGPIERGFDRYFGVDLPNLPPFTFIEQDRVLQQPTSQYQVDDSEGIVLPRGFEGAPTAPGWRMQEILPELTRRAVDYIHQAAGQEQPFFLYFSMTSPHEPIVPTRPFRGRSGIAPIADFVMQTDAAVGEVIEAMENSGIANRSLIIFTADNGHSHYTGWEDLVRAGHMPSGPYRGHKGDIWEGGHRVPLIVRWPGQIKAGTSSEQLVSLTDLYATVAEIVGAAVPLDSAEDSLSFLSAALHRSPAAGSRTSLVSHSNFGEFAYRSHDWKLVFRLADKNLESSRGKPTVVELYNLRSDIGEQNSVADQHPEIVEHLTRELEALIQRGATRTGMRSPNDCRIDIHTTQTRRWAPPSQR